MSPAQVRGPVCACGRGLESVAVKSSSLQKWKRVHTGGLWQFIHIGCPPASHCLPTWDCAAVENVPTARSLVSLFVGLSTHLPLCPGVTETSPVCRHHCLARFSGAAGTRAHALPFWPPGHSGGEVGPCTPWYACASAPLIFFPRFSEHHISHSPRRPAGCWEHRGCRTRRTLLLRRWGKCASH